MRDGIIYDCPNANCRTPIYTGKCRKACIEKHNKEMGTKPKTNADRIRAMSDEELASWLAKTQIDNVAEALKIARVPWEQHPDLQELTAKDCLEWLKKPAEV